MARIRTTGTASVKGADKGKNPDQIKAANAQRGVTHSEIREGTPLQIESKLLDLEKSGRITSGITEYADDALLDSLAFDDELMDCDIDLADEDDFLSGSSDSSCQSAVSSIGSWEELEDSAIDSSSRIEICVHRDSDGDKVSCSVKEDPRIGFDCHAPEASNLLDDLSSRYKMLEKIGEWLAVNRKEFLKTGDLWDFAEQASSEANLNMPSVLQQNFIIMADLAPDTPEKFKPLFSRYINNVVLSWEEEGCMLLGMLFSHRARCAWVARAYYELRKRKNGGEILIETLWKCHAKRKYKNARLRTEISNLNPAEAAERLCSLVTVQGADVVNQYKEKFSGAQK